MDCCTDTPTSVVAQLLERTGQHFDATGFSLPGLSMEDTAAALEGMSPDEKFVLLESSWMDLQSKDAKMAKLQRHLQNDDDSTEKKALTLDSRIRNRPVPVWPPQGSARKTPAHANKRQRLEVQTSSKVRVPVHVEDLEDSSLFQQSCCFIDGEPVTMFRQLTSSVVVLFLGDSVYEGLCGSYTLVGGVLRDGDNEPIPYQSVPVQSQSAPVQSQWADLKELFAFARRSWVVKHKVLFEPFVLGKVLTRMETQTEARESGVIDGLMDRFRAAHTDVLKSATGIRDYQIEGVKWMLQRHAEGAGMILGDEMGLGKTMQAILFMKAVSSCSELPHAVIAPVSVIGAWVRELERWWPESRVVTLHGSERDSIKHNRLVKGTFDVVLTSPETLRSEKNWYGRQEFNLLCFDEAHKTKNEESLVSKAARRVRTLNRLLLTGTPVQNNTHEIFALLNLMFPEAFTSSALFDDAFDLGCLHASIDLSLLKQMSSALNKIMLRRTKASVGLDIPEKSIQTVYVDMAPQQKFWYKALLTQQQHLLDGSAPLLKSALLNLMMQLRKCCNHPYAFEGAEPEPYFSGEHLVQASGKFLALDKLLTHVLSPTDSNPHRVVIFSSFISTLDMLEELMNLRGHSYLRLDGSTPRAQRQIDVEEFQAPGSSWLVYLVSTSAGGLGLTLTAADHVVLLDQNYNPQIDKQAMDRVHRIGQTRPVTVYKFVCRNTAEESISLRAGQKLFLDSAVMSDQNRTSEGKAPDSGTALLQPDALLSMVMHGVTGLMDDASTERELSWAETLERSHKLEVEGMAVAHEGNDSEEKLKEMLTQRASGCRLFEGVDYNTLKVQKTHCSLRTNENETKIADAWTAAKRVRTAAVERTAAIEVKGFGKLGEAAESQVIECNMCLDFLRRPANCFNLFVLERVKKHVDNKDKLMQVVSREWKALTTAQRAVYELKAAKDRRRFLKEAAAVIRNFGIPSCDLEQLEASDEEEQWQHRSTCAACNVTGGELTECPRCPISLHADCMAESCSHTNGFRCSWHKCSVCLGSASACGGALLCCTGCAQAFCVEHRPPGSTITRECDWATQLGFCAPKSMIYFECNQCCSSNGKRQQ